MDELNDDAKDELNPKVPLKRKVLLDEPSNERTDGSSSYGG